MLLVWASRKSHSGLDQRTLLLELVQSYRNAKRQEKRKAAPMHDLERRVIGKVMRRLIPFLILCYFVAYLDRVNVSFAKLHMNQALGFSDAAFGLGAGLFSSLISYLRCLPTSFSSELARGFGSPAL